MTNDTRNELLNAGWKYETNGVWASPDDPPRRYGESNAEGMLIHAWKDSKRKIAETSSRFTDAQNIAIGFIITLALLAGAAFLGIYIQ